MSAAARQPTSTGDALTGDGRTPTQTASSIACAWRRGAGRAQNNCASGVSRHRHKPQGLWHPWVRVERAIRAVLADRLTHGPSVKVDQVLMARIKGTQEDPARRVVQT